MCARHRLARDHSIDQGYFCWCLGKCPEFLGVYLYVYCVSTHCCLVKLDYSGPLVEEAEVKSKAIRKCPGVLLFPGLTSYSSFVPCFCFNIYTSCIHILLHHHINAGATTCR